MEKLGTQSQNLDEVHILQNILRLPKGTTWINYIRCHDDIGLGYADQDIPAADWRSFFIQRITAAYSALY
nr:hypothetical protein [uncultured Tolumonas sp.]